MIARNTCSPSREIDAHHQRNAQIVDVSDAVMAIPVWDNPQISGGAKANPAGLP